jgi:GGDEF domain-containing protein
VTQILSDLYYFTRRVTDEAARSRRSGTNFSIALLKSQPIGDQLPEAACVEAIPTVLENVRDTDTVARMNADTIAVLFIDADGEGSRKAALRLLERLGDDLGCWSVSVLDYPQRSAQLAELGLVA